MRQKIVDLAPAAPLMTPLSFCHHRKHPEIRSQNCVFQQPASEGLARGAASYPARSSILPSLRPPQAQASPSSERLAAPMSPLFCSAGALRLRAVAPYFAGFFVSLRV